MNERYVTTIYAPTEEAKKLYGEMIAEPGQNTILLNSGSLSEDLWFQKNGTYETSEQDNIADKNPSWCELTTIYWMWKHSKASPDEWIEHAHYRKFLFLPPGADLYGREILVSSPWPMMFNVNGRTQKMTVESGTRLCHPSLMWNTMEDVITKDLNWSGTALWDEWRNKDELYAPLQMWRMKKKLFDEYCEWMFPHLDEIYAVMSKKIETETWRKRFDNAYQKRYMAFIGERMFSWWAFSQMMGGVKVGQVGVARHDDFKPFKDEEERESAVNPYIGGQS